VFFFFVSVQTESCNVVSFFASFGLSERELYRLGLNHAVDRSHARTSVGGRKTKTKTQARLNERKALKLDSKTRKEGKLKACVLG
jgi:hypothetical protein